MTKTKNKAKNKITKQVMGIVLLSALICLAIYIIYVVIGLFVNPTDSFIIKKELLTAEENTVGYVIREETVIDSKSYKNGIVKIKDEGQKVAIGENIFRYYTENEEKINKQIKDLDEQIQEALKGQKSLLTSDIKSLDIQIEARLDDLRNKNSVQEIQEYKKDIDGYISKKARIAGELSPSGSYINNLIKQKIELEQELYNNTEYIKADVSGVVSYRIDDLENVLTPNNFEDLSKARLEDLNIKTGQIVPSSDNQVKIINNFECYIAIASNSEEAKKVKVGDNIYLRLSNTQKTKANIQYIKEEGNNRLLILKITNGVENLINYRKISVDIIWWEKEGLKVPNSSIIYENGLSYVIRKGAGSLSKILVKVEQENNTYCIIRNYRTSELEELGHTAEEIRKMKQVNIYDEILANPSLEDL